MGNADFGVSRGAFGRLEIGSVFDGSSRGCGFPIGSGIFGEAMDRPAFLERILGVTAEVEGLKVIGFVVGPTTKLLGEGFGAGAGMYGCLRPLGSVTIGTLRGAEDGVTSPLDSPVNLGISSQLDATEGPTYAGLSGGPGIIVGGEGLRLEPFSFTRIVGFRLGPVDVVA